MNDCVDLLNDEALEELSLSIKKFMEKSGISCNACSEACWLGIYLKRMILSLVSNTRKKTEPTTINVKNNSDGCITVSIE